MNTWSRGEVSVDGLTFVYHRTGGDKPPLVLCHGITDNGLCFTRVARELEDAFDIIMLDARIDKNFDIGESSVTVGIDVFNLLNEDYVLQRQRNVNAGTANQVREVLSPRVFRLGIKFHLR